MKTNSPLSPYLPLALALRPQMTLIPWLICCSVIFVYKGSPWLYLLSLVLLVSCYGFVTIFNDLADYEIDKINKRKRLPLVSQTVSPHALRKVALILLGVIIVSSAAISTHALLWASVYLALGWAYSGSPNSKGRGIIAAYLLGVCYGVMPWLLGFISAQTAVSAEHFAIIVASFIFTTGIVLLKDFKDQKGDKKFGKRTFLVRHGAKKTHHLILGLTSASYFAIAIISYLIWQKAFISIVTLILLIIHSTLLYPKEIRQKAPMRAQNGGRARAMFFAWMIIIGAILTL